MQHDVSSETWLPVVGWEGHNGRTRRICRICARIRDDKRRVSESRQVA